MLVAREHVLGVSVVGGCFVITGGWGGPTPIAVRLAGRLLNALNKVVFATSKVMLHVATCLPVVRKML